MATRKTASPKASSAGTKKSAGNGKASKVKSTTAKKTAAGKTAKTTVKAKAAKPVKQKTAAKAEPKAKRKVKTTDEAFRIAQSAVSGILEKKGENIVCLDLRNIENAVCDYFIICEANSNIQVEAIGQSVKDMVKKELSERPYRSEGWENALWILIDYVNVVVHVFQRETRQFYNLESLWADAETVDLVAPGKKKRA